MILRGIVNTDCEARLRLRLRGFNGVSVDADALVDTGYSGALSLPIQIASQLGLIPRRGGVVFLADGTSVKYVSFGVDVEWLGTYRPVVAAAFGDDVVIGMGLLSGHALMIEATVGGAVTIVPLMNAL
jgi:clan AA aspartic protease